jgi:hypothetical protein
MPGVCAVHAVMLGGASPPSRYTWSRRTREAQGRHREVGSEGSGERTCGTRNTHRIEGVGQPGRAGTQPHSPPSTSGLCVINSASMHGRYDRLPREASQVPRAVAGHGNGLSVESSELIAWEESADGRVGMLCVPKAGTGDRRGPGGWTEAMHLTSSSVCPVPREGVQHRLAHREKALQAMKRVSWHAGSRGLTS